MGYNRLYGSHFLSTFGDRLWQFATPILFINVWRNTLLPSAVFMFTLYTVKVFLLPTVGRIVDTSDRLRLVSIGTFGQCICTSLSAALLFILGSLNRSSGAEFAASAIELVLFGSLILIGIVGDLCSKAGSIGVEKDWVVVISAGDQDLLTRLNVTLRRIDLFSKFGAPLAFGIATDFVQDLYEQLKFGVAIVLCFSVFSAVPIYCAWKSVYLKYPALQAVRPRRPATNPLAVVVQSNRTYCRHPVFLASLAYCCLYFTVLSDHHPLTTAYLKIAGVSNAWLGAARGGGGLAGILGTYLFPFLQSRCGLKPTNVFAAWAFVLCIVPISILYLPSYTGDILLRSYLMLGAIVVSRIFLWCFDLANVSLIQTLVQEFVRGELSAAQDALCQIMELIMAILALLFSNNFSVLVFGSAGGVSAAAVVLTIWTCCCRKDSRTDALSREDCGASLAEPQG